MKKLTLFVVWCCCCVVGTSYAADYSWNDPYLIQFENMSSELEDTLNDVASEAGSVGFGKVSFSVELDENFRKIIETRVLESLTQHESLKVVICAECSEVRTYIHGNSLNISRGTADPEYRQTLAKKYHVSSFLHISVFVVEEKLSISLNVQNAKTGATTFSKSLVGQVSQNVYTNVFLGALTVGIKPVLSNKETVTNADGTTSTEETFSLASSSTDYQAMLLGVERNYRVGEYVYFLGSAAIFSENASETQTTEDVDLGEPFSGVLLDGNVLLSSNFGKMFSMGFLVGAGQMFSNALNSPLYGRAGFRFGIYQGFNLTINQLFFQVEEPEADGGQYISIGWQF